MIAERAEDAKVKLSEDGGKVTLDVFPSDLRALLAQVSREGLLDLLVAFANLAAVVDAELQRRPQREPEQRPEADRLLSPEEAAERFGVKRRWLLERADDIPGARRLSKKVIRFSEHALSWHLAKGRP